MTLYVHYKILHLNIDQEYLRENVAAAVSLLTHFVGKMYSVGKTVRYFCTQQSWMCEKKLIFCHMPLKRDANEAFQNWSADERSTMTVKAEVSSTHPRELINEMFASSEDGF